MVSLLGIVLLLGIAYLLSSHRSQINWRTVGGAFAIQALIGAFILYFEPGIKLLLSMTEFVGNIIAYSQDGINFVFGAVGRQIHRIYLCFQCITSNYFLFLPNSCALLPGYHGLGD